MSLQMIQLPDTNYFHREYQYDIPNGPTEDSWLSITRRVGLIALPLVSLYAPLNYPFAIAIGSVRVLSWSLHLDSLCDGVTLESAFHLVQTMIAVGAVAGTLFAHPIGMLITTGQDLLILLAQTITHLCEQEYQLAFGDCLHIVNNALYLAAYLSGGLEIAIASIAMQVILAVAHSVEEFQNGNHLEGAGYALIATARGAQLSEYLDALLIQWRLEEFFKNK